MKRKNIFTLALAALLVACGGGHGSPITAEEAVTQASTMKEKVTSEEFVAPTKVHIKTSITANSSQYSEKMDVEIYQDLDNYGYSMKMFAEETEAGEKQEESMYMGVWLEGTVLYMAMTDGETKEYAKMDCGEQATEMFYSSIQGAGQSFDKTFFATQLDMVAAIFDTEAMENSLKEALGAFAASAEVNASTSAATKGEGHLYVEANCSLSFAMEESGASINMSATSKSTAEFDNYLIVSAYEEANVSMSASYNGETESDTMNTVTSLTADYGTSFAKPDLAGYTERTAN